jgi:TonB-dependent receptor
MGATAFPAAFAQEPGEGQIEEIVVTGIRGSLEQSMDRKRSAVGVVDAITAEDIGKFPDQNLAESLQRITGVSIDRSNNEGSRVTVRGMGPEFNLVTLNGRSMPTAGGRSFDFNDIASEGVRAVEIYKTAKAGLPTGGIGATVNIITARPLDNPGFRSVISAKAVHETSSSDDSVANLDPFTPEIAAIYSNTFADDTIGVMISASYQERDNREENASVDNWGQNLQLDGGIINNNNQRADGVWWHPQNVGYGWADISRDRINSQLVFQYAPTDRITATLDYTYSELEFEKDANSTGIWFECPNIEATVNERGTVTQVSQACGDYSTNVARDHTIKENDSLGFNVEFQATDSLLFELDMHSSTSELRGAGIGGEPGSSQNLIIGNTNCPWCDPNAGFGNPTAGIALQTATYGSGGIPTFDVSFAAPDGSPQSELLRSDIGSLFAQAFDTNQTNDILQVQLDGTWENLSDGAISRFNFGYSYTEQEYVTRSAESGLLPAGFWLTSAQYWPDDIWEEGNLGSLLDGFSNGGDFSYDPYFTVDFDTAINLWETIGATDPISGVYWPSWGPDFQDTANNRGRVWSGPLGNGGAAWVDENIDSLYAEAVFEDEFNGMAFNAVIGVRYEQTEMRSYGREVNPSAIVWVGGNEFQYERTADPAFPRGSSTNKFWLPSLDLDMEVYQDVIARFSYSRSIARPPIGDLTPNRTFVGNPNVRNRVVSVGNPDLLPYVSDNFDISLEWYYGEGSYASVGYFKKRVENFLVGRTTQQTFPELGLLDPYIGAEAELARAQLIAQNISPTDQEVFRQINLNRGTAVTDPVRAQPGDPLTVFDVTRTQNEETGNLFGWELAVQHMFWDTGFGVQANLTVVNGDVDADRDTVDRTFALPGLSDSANLAVFYENDIISARLAYNWRDEFLSGFDRFDSPVYTEEYAPLDANVTWFATDQLSVFFEAINITEEVQRIYVRYPEQFIRGNQYGARFNIGARYNFE